MYNHREIQGGLTCDFHACFNERCFPCRVHLSKRHSSLKADRRKARMDASRIAQCLRNVKRTASESPSETTSRAECHGETRAVGVLFACVQ